MDRLQVVYWALRLVAVTADSIEHRLVFPRECHWAAQKVERFDNLLDRPSGVHWVAMKTTARAQPWFENWAGKSHVTVVVHMGNLKTKENK